MKILAEKIHACLNLDVPVIKDPYNHDYSIAQATHPLAFKGEALQQLSRYLQIVHPIIAAGDDNNDLSMLKVADIKIVIKDSPQGLLDIADILADGPENLGIIDALKRAIVALNIKE